MSKALEIKHVFGDEGVEFDDWLVMARKAFGFTQTQLAAKCGFSRRTIVRLESGESEPQLRFLSRLHSVFQAKVDRLATKHGKDLNRILRRCDKETRTEWDAIGSRILQHSRKMEGDSYQNGWDMIQEALQLQFAYYQFCIQILSLKGDKK